MNAYTRKPERAVAQCSVNGCKWRRIYFEDPNKRMRCAARASQALETHYRRAHEIRIANCDR